VFVGFEDLQPTDECNGSHVVIAIIHQGYMALETIDVMFEALSSLHLDHEEVIDVLLELPLGGILVIEGLLYLFETLERVPQEIVEPIIGGAFEIGWKHTAQEEVIVKVDCHLVLIPPEVLDGIGRPKVSLEIQYYELLGKVVRGDFL